MMIIEVMVGSPREVLFCDVGQGECFGYKGGVFLKIAGLKQAVVLKEEGSSIGSTITFSDCLIVEALKGEVHVKSR